MYRVLAIDGGGIRGIIPAMVLAEIERRTGKPICRLFDLIAGTSTGGILAVGLTKPSPEKPKSPRQKLNSRKKRPQYSALELVDLYEQEGPRIFSRSLWHRVTAMGNIFEEKYPAVGIEKVLEEYLGDARLKDTLTDVIVTSYDLERRQPFFFKTRHGRNKPGFDFSLKQIARATSAVPTYFEPVKIEANPPQLGHYSLIDGGVYANNPAMCAYAEIKHLHPETEDILIVSLGTGEHTRRIPHEEACTWGLASWAHPILSIVLDGICDTVDYQLRQLLTERENRKRYYRLQTVLYQGSDDMDDASRTNLFVLKLLAQELIDKNQEVLEEICRQLS